MIRRGYKINKNSYFKVEVQTITPGKKYDLFLAEGIQFDAEMEQQFIMLNKVFSPGLDIAFIGQGTWIVVQKGEGTNFLSLQENTRIALLSVLAQAPDFEIVRTNDGQFLVVMQGCCFSFVSNPDDLEDLPFGTAITVRILMLEACERGEAYAFAISN